MANSQQALKTQWVGACVGSSMQSPAWNGFQTKFPVASEQTFNELCWHSLSLINRYYVKNTYSFTENGDSCQCAMTEFIRIWNRSSKGPCRGCEVIRGPLNVHSYESNYIVVTFCATDLTKAFSAFLLHAILFRSYTQMLRKACILLKQTFPDAAAVCVSSFNSRTMSTVDRQFVPFNVNDVCPVDELQLSPVVGRREPRGTTSSYVTWHKTGAQSAFIVRVHRMRFCRNVNECCDETLQQRYLFLFSVIVQMQLRFLLLTDEIIRNDTVRSTSVDFHREPHLGPLRWINRSGPSMAVYDSNFQGARRVEIKWDIRRL